MDMAIFKGRGRLVTKINITFFMGNEVLNVSYLTIFSKKNKKQKKQKETNKKRISGAGSAFSFNNFFKKIFSKITAKNYFWGA